MLLALPIRLALLDPSLSWTIPTAVGSIAIIVLILFGGRVVRLLGEIRDAQGKLDRLDDLTATVERWSQERDAVDLRRIEHGLQGLRDGQGRFEASVLRLVESIATDRSVEVTPLAPGPSVDLAERITNRLLASGFTRVEIVTRRDELAAIGDEGLVQVEARRDGIVHKGSVRLEDGRIVDLALRPAFTMFP